MEALYVCLIATSCFATSIQESNVQDKINQLEETLAGIITMVQGMKHDMGLMKEDIKAITEKQSGEVAFFAQALVASDNNGVDYYENEVVQYPTVVLNKGDAYDPSTSIFTCSASGIYVFLATVHNIDSGTIYTDLYVGDSPVSRLNVLDDGNWNQASNSAIVSCNAGMQVRVVSYGWSRVWGGTVSTFGGAFLGLN